MKQLFKSAVIPAAALLALTACGEESEYNKVEDTEIESSDSITTNENGKTSTNVDNIIAKYTLAQARSDNNGGSNYQTVITEFRNVADPTRVTIAATYYNGITSVTLKTPRLDEAVSPRLLAANEAGAGVVYEFTLASANNIACNVTVDVRQSSDNSSAPILECHEFEGTLASGQGTAINSGRISL